MDNENVSQFKETWFDKIFKPQVITLENGHVVRRPRSRTPLILLVVLLVVFWSLRMTGFDLMVVIKKIDKLTYILVRLFNPDWSFFPKVVTPLVDTIKMSILGTVIGFIRTVLAANSQELVSRADLLTGSMEALVSAAVGLFVGILATVMYGSLRVRLDRTVVELEAAASQVIGYLSAMKEKELEK